MKKTIIVLLTILAVAMLVSCDGSVDKELFGTEEQVKVQEISFTLLVDDTLESYPLKAIKGMTWSEFIESSYNTIELWAVSPNVLHESGTIQHMNYVEVLLTDKIEEITYLID